MTCIIGMFDVKNDCVWIGGDSMGSNGYTQSIYSNPKIFHHYLNKNVIFGSTSTFRHIDLLQYSEKLLPELDFYKEKEIDRKYMVQTFIPNLIELFQRGIYESENERGGTFIMGAVNKLFEIQADYSVLEPKCGYCAVGSGQVAALGSLYATTTCHPEWDCKKHIRLGLEAAEKHCCGVQRPFRIINTLNEEEEIIE